MTVCVFQPAPHHMAGPTHVLNGGIIATVVDCHCVCTAIADAYRAAGRELGTAPHIWCVTASLKVDYLAPTRIGAPAELRARVREAKGRRRVVECELRSEGQPPGTGGGGGRRGAADVVAPSGHAADRPLLRRGGNVMALADHPLDPGERAGVVDAPWARG